MDEPRSHDRTWDRVVLVNPDGHFLWYISAFGSLYPIDMPLKALHFPSVEALNGHAFQLESITRANLRAGGWRPMRLTFAVSEIAPDRDHDHAEARPIVAEACVE